MSPDARVGETPALPGTHRHSAPKLDRHAAAKGLFVIWVVLVYAAYFLQFDFYASYALGLLRRVMPFGAG